MRETRACRPHSGWEVREGQGARQPQDLNLWEASAARRVSGLTKAAKTRFRARRPLQITTATVASRDWLAAPESRRRGRGLDPPPVRGYGWHGPPRQVITIATRASRDLELCTACSETSGLHWSARVHHDNQGVDEQAEPVRGIGSRFTLATLVGRVVTVPGKGVLIWL